MDGGQQRRHIAKVIKAKRQVKYIKRKYYNLEDKPLYKRKTQNHKRQKHFDYTKIKISIQD
jgi:hypothetical protein